MEKLKIAIGCDHGGFNLKNTVIKYLKDKGFEYEDFGIYVLEPSDYPEMAKRVAEAVAAKKFDRGILLCGSGLGMSITANKVKGIRAVTIFDTFCAKASRTHNDSNVLCLGERIIGEYLALDIVDTWLHTDFEGGRHKKRIDMIE